MHPTEKEVYDVCMGLLMKIESKQEDESGTLVLVGDVLRDILLLGDAVANKLPEKDKDDAWEELQDVVKFVELCESLNTKGWKMVAYSLVSIFLREHDTFLMFYNKLREAALGIHMQRCTCGECEGDHNEIVH